MSATIELQRKIAEVLAASPAMRVKCPIAVVRKLHKGSAVDVAAAKKSGLCVLVLQPLPLSSMGEETMEFAVIDNLEVVVGVYEQPAVNPHQEEAFDVMEDIIAALHGQHFPELIIAPLALQKRPITYADDAQHRVIEVRFKAVMPMGHRQT